jgi:retron-type reverse transcriptase
VASADRHKPNPAQMRLQERQYELTVPSVADRIAQTAAARLLEEKLEPIFHPDSYGYRPGRSAHDALATRILERIAGPRVANRVVRGIPAARIHRHPS